jgi:glutathione S-transferase
MSQSGKLIPTPAAMLLTACWQQHGGIAFLVNKRISIMLIFYGAGSAFGLPDPSPFVMKSEVQLKMAGVPYRFERAVPSSAPKGKLPFIQIGAHRIGDTTFIRAYLEMEHDVDFDKALSRAERAHAWAIERMLEDHLYFALVHTRWLDDENFEKGPAHFFDGAPEGVAQAARQRVRAKLDSQGLGSHREDEIISLGNRSLEALSVLLGDKQYLFGDAPCGVDATAFAMVAGVLTPFFHSQLRKRAERHTNLIAYRDRMMQQYYPEFVRAAA